QHLTIGGDTGSTTFATEGFAGLEFEPQLLSRLSQIRRFERGIFQLLGRLDETLLDLLRLEITRQLVLEAVEARYFRRLNAQQLDQVPAELTLHRGGNLVLLQRIECFFESGVINTRAGVAQITTFGCRARILRKLLGQSSEVFTRIDTLLDLFDLAARGIIIAFDEDVCSLTLLGQVGDFALVQGLQVFVADLDLLEETVLLQFNVLKHHLLGAHEFAGMLVVICLNLTITQLDRRRVGLDGEAGEVTGLTLEIGECTCLLLGDEAAGTNAGTQLADQHFLLQHLAELQAGVSHLANELVEASSIEAAIYLEFGSLQNHLIQRTLRKGEVSVIGSLQQQLALDQPLERSLTQQLVIQQRGIEITPQLLQQLPALHFNGLIELAEGDGLTVHVSRIVAVAGTCDDGFETGKGHQHHDEADDDFGNPTA